MVRVIAKMKTEHYRKNSEVHLLSNNELDLLAFLRRIDPRKEMPTEEIEAMATLWWTMRMFYYI